jgi:rhamnulokinase
VLAHIVEPGTVLGPLKTDVVEETSLKGVKMVAPGTHDTASAVAAVPAEGDDHAYLSSGTWSLMGVETAKPVINDLSYDLSFTNEGGVEGTVRLLKNICGLWLQQECRRIWTARGDARDFNALRAEAMKEKPFAALIDPDDASFAQPCDMPARIQAYCRAHGQKAPRSEGAIIRAILESLALKYRMVFDRLETLTGRRLGTLHIVGGGTQNLLLNQLAANAVGRRVVTGPVEATAAGNILMQMRAMGDLGSLAEGRELIRRSFKVNEYEPKDGDAWAEAYARFQKLVS